MLLLWHAVNSDEAPLIDLKHYEAVGVFGVDTVVADVLMRDIISEPLESAKGLDRLNWKLVANAVQTGNGYC